ncbi:hypothetical protein [Actinomadura sp. WAC 06369]|uniref:SLOG cluster 4 domain-containing protein n=1 Tax=Actinomadura sp. WAC 06369 TaxID=2203193 RepID=UPI000F7699DE|nr:hypothetical protein [Actinomadura sp. WAC 06369]
MTRRKVFNPGDIPMTFWSCDEVAEALADRDVGRLFRLFLARYPECTQTQLALLTQHDRSDVSNWVRGARQGRVSDIEVLTRIADGMQIPDRARLSLGLAPADPLPLKKEPIRPWRQVIERDTDATENTGRPVCIAICGSRTADADGAVIDDAVRCMARLVLSHGYRVSHGPVGVGIEVLTYIADQYRPPGIARAVGLFGHRNVIQHADLVVVVGGGTGTQTEIDLALSMGKAVIALPASGGAARRFYTRAARDERLRAMSEEQFTALGAGDDPAEDLARIIEELLSRESGETGV